MRPTARFLLGDAVREVGSLDPTMTVLDYLRTVERLTGTKEGCAEGDCGACTVVLGEPRGDGMVWRAVNACVLFWPVLDGCQVLTVEHLRGPGGRLHPAQQAIVAHHASQCGFCTPGFVMSLAALRQSGEAPDRAGMAEALAGNLCRCTGYRPIVEAGLEACPGGTADAAQDRATADRLAALDTTAPLAIDAHGSRYIAPVAVDALADAYVADPDAVLVAGGTDVGLWVTKQHRRLSSLIALDRVRGFDRITQTATAIQIGAGATYQDALPALERHYPDFGALIRRIGSRQIRNCGTLGGNVANGSPIGDTMPALLALDTTLLLRRGDRRRHVALDEFYTGYRQTVLQPGEFVERIDVKLPEPDSIFRAYKIAKRFDQDISGVCAAFALRLDSGIVRGIRIAFGGMAATPSRARSVEAALLGQPWTEASVRAAARALAAAFAPIGDMRASAAYRRLLAGNLLWKFYLETTSPDTRTRLSEIAA